MRKISFGLLMWSSAAVAMPAFFVREEPSDIAGKKVCVYNYMGKELGVLRPITSTCPSKIDVD